MTSTNLKHAISVKNETSWMNAMVDFMIAKMSKIANQYERMIKMY